MTISDGAQSDDSPRLAPAEASTTATLPELSTRPVAPPGSRRWLTPILALVAVAVIALFGGILIGQNTAPASQAASFNRANGGLPQRGDQLGQGAGGTAGLGTGSTGKGLRQGSFGALTAGTIVSIDGNTIIVKDRAGATITVTTTGSTTVSQTTKSIVSKLKPGETITVRGTTGTDGNVAATSVTEGNQAFGVRPGTAGTGTAG